MVRCYLDGGTLYPMVTKHQMNVRLGDDLIAALAVVADSAFEGSRSMALRRLLILGLGAWNAGARSPEQVGRKP